jgi:hypothetical protein
VKQGCRALSLLFTFWLLISSIGCVTTAARISAYLQCKSEDHLARQQFHQDELEAKKAHLEAERRAMLAERQMELAQRRAECDKRSCQMQSQYEESIRTQLGLDLDQRIKVGQIQVNTAELQQLLEERERDHADRMRVYKQLKQQQSQAQFQQWKQAQLGEVCCTCVESGCDAPGPTCEAPCAAGCCQRCGLPKQPVFSNDCAGNRPFREAPTRPLQEPLTAAQIPMMLPVTIEVGMTNSRIGQSHVRRLPQLGAESLKQPCQCEGCRRGRSCVKSLPPACEAPVYPSKSQQSPHQLPGQHLPPGLSPEFIPEPAPPSEVTESGRRRFRLANWLDQDESNEAENRE